MSDASGRRRGRGVDDGDAVSRAVRAITRLAKVAEIAARDADLSLAQYRLLTYLAEGSAAATALAERLIISKPSVTALVDGLVERGLVDRQHDPDDRRRINHLLTDQGRRVLTTADAALADMLTRLTERLDPTAGREAIDGLARIHVALDLALAERELGPTGRATSAVSG